MRSSVRSWRKGATAGSRIAAAAVIAASLLAACSAGASPSAPPPPVVTGAWVRLPVVAGSDTAAYLTIANAGPADAVVAVTSPDAASCQLMRTASDGSGMTGMQMIDRLDVPAGGTVVLAPGGYHVMLHGLAPTTAGSTVELDLAFEHAGIVRVMAEVRAG